MAARRIDPGDQRGGSRNDEGDGMQRFFLPVPNHNYNIF
jgi:hypothetical protein